MSDRRPPPARPEIAELIPQSKSRNLPARRLLDRFIYFSLLTVIVLTAIPYGTVQPWWISTFECAVFMIAILAVVEMFISKSWHLDLSLVLPLLAIIAFAIIQSWPLFRGTGPISPVTSLSADPYGTRLFAIELSALVLGVLLLLHYTSTRKRLRSLIYVIIGVGVATAVFGIIRQKFQRSTGFLLPALPMGGRSFGQFINRNHFALLLEMSLGLTLGLIIEAGRHRRVLALIAIAALFYVTIIYSNSRGAIVASLCQLLFLGVALDPVRHLTSVSDDTKWGRVPKLVGGFAVRAFLILFLIAVLVYGVGWIGGEPVASNFQLAAWDFSQQEMRNNANTSRKEIWSATWRMIKAHPLAGVGFSAYWIAITKYHNASGEFTPQQAHNDYLELMASGGLIGFGLVAWFGVVFLRRSLRSARSPDTYCRSVCLGAFAGIFSVAIHSFVDFGLHITINALVFFVLVVIAVQSDRLQCAGNA